MNEGLTTNLYEQIASYLPKNIKSNVKLLKQKGFNTFINGVKDL